MAIMEKLKVFLLKFPEYYLTIIVFLGGFKAPLSIDPWCLIVSFLLIAQIILQYRILGVVIAALFTFMTVYFLLAFLSRYHEHINNTIVTRNLLLVGIPFFILNFSSVGIMYYKYFFVSKH